jgi:hypothetical protein
MYTHACRQFLVTTVQAAKRAINIMRLHVFSPTQFFNICMRTLCPFIFGIPLQFARICGDAIYELHNKYMESACAEM